MPETFFMVFSLDSKGAKVCECCKSRHELSKEYLVFPSTCKHRLRYSRERASSSFYELGYRPSPHSGSTRPVSTAPRTRRAFEVISTALSIHPNGLGVLELGRQTLEGSFWAVSKPNFASKYAFESSRRDLHNALLCTALKPHFLPKFARILAKKIAKIFRTLSIANFAEFCKN